MGKAELSYFPVSSGIEFGEYIRSSPANIPGVRLVPAFGANAIRWGVFGVKISSLLLE